MPRTAPWRGGAMGTSRPTATGHGWCARRRGTRGAHATGIRVGRAVWAHEGGGMPSHAPRQWRGGASRESRRPIIAPYRQAARAVRTATGHERCARNGMRGGVRRGEGKAAFGKRCFLASGRQTDFLSVSGKSARIGKIGSLL